MFRLGMPELLVILAIVFLIFGAKRLPEIAKGIGQSISSFKNGLKETGDVSNPGRDENK